MEGKTVSIGKAFSFGWEATKKRLGFWIGLLIVSGLMVIIPSLLTQALAEEQTGLSFVFALIQYLVELGLGLSMIHIALMTVDGKTPAFQELFFGFRNGPLFGRYIWASLLVGLIVMVGFILLIIPGVIMSLKYGYFGFFLVDKEAKVMPSIKMSGLATKGNLWTIFVFGLAAVGISLLGLIPFGLGLFLTIPTIAIAQGHLYRQLSHGVTVPSAPVLPKA